MESNQEPSAEKDATWEGLEPDPDAFGAAGYLLRPPAENGLPEPGDLLAEVEDVNGIVWTRYHTDPTGKGQHWWAFAGGWRAFADLDNPRALPPGKTNTEVME